MGRSLDDYAAGVSSQDTRKRLQTYSELIPHLQDFSTSLQCEDMDKFVDGLSNWISSSNYKVRYTS